MSATVRASRGSEPSWSARKDPVVWGSTATADGPLDRMSLERFERAGFLVFPGMLSDEVSALRDAARAETRTAPHRIFEPGPDGAEEVVRSVFAMHERAPFDDLVADSRLAGCARQILADQVYIHQSRINFKPAFDGQPFEWHSDFETWHQEDGMPRMRALSAVVALDAITPNNGPLMVLPGSHHVFIACVGATPADHHRVSLRAQTIGVPDRESIRRLAAERAIVAPVGPPGTVILFDCNLVHGSNGNITPDGRASLFFVYNAVSNALGQPVCGQPPRPAHIATRDARPLPLRPS